MQDVGSRLPADGVRHGPSGRRQIGKCRLVNGKSRRRPASKRQWVQACVNVWRVPEQTRSAGNTCLMRRVIVHAVVPTGLTLFARSVVLTSAMIYFTLLHQ